jgi:hypothetical protein
MARTRTTTVRSKIRLEGSVSEALEAVIEALPKDAIVRGEDDGVGRFAGDRTLVIRGKEGDRLLMFHGSYGSIKSRLSDPHLDVLFKAGKKGPTARLRREEVPPKTILAHIMDLLGQMLTVAIVVIVYHIVRDLPIDRTLTAAIAAGGGAALWGFTLWRGKKPDTELEDSVRKALEPMTRKSDDDRDKDEEAEEAPEEQSESTNAT